MGEFSALWAGVEAAKPDDPLPLLVTADWCDEHDKASLAFALRWCAAHTRRPYRRTDVVRTPWQWIRDQRSYSSGSLSLRKVNSRREAVLSEFIFAARFHGENNICFPSQRQAYEWLWLALDRLRKVVEMPDIVLPPQPAIISLAPVTCAACGIMRGRDTLECFVCKSSEVKS